MKIIKDNLASEKEIKSHKFKSVLSGVKEICGYENNLDPNNVNLSQTPQSLSQEELDKIKEDAKKEAYEEGLKNGYSDGYNLFMQKKEEELSSINQDIDNLKASIDEEMLSYLNNKKDEIIALIKNSINKIFHNSISDEIVLKNYFNCLIEYISLNYKKFTFSMNNYTYNLLLKEIEKNKIIVEVDSDIKDFDFIIKTSNENIEVYLKDELEKLISLIN